MVSVKLAPSLLWNWLSRLNPLAGIDGQEVGKAYQVFIKDPSAGILHIIAAARHSRWEHWVEARLARQASALADQQIQIDISALKTLPAHTLGGAYARHIIQQGFDPHAFVQDEQHWLRQRSALAHDVYHVITGFDGSPVGEFGLAAFSLVQRWDLLNVFVLSHLPWTCLGFVHLVPQLLGSVGRGFWLGWQADPLIAYPFEQNWHKSLSEVRQELGLIQGRF